MMLMTLSFLCGLIGSILIDRFGGKVGLIDIPNERSSHEKPTPRGGGIGIWLSFMLAVFFSDTKEIVFIVFAGIVGMIGFIEDIFTIPAKYRLLGHVAVTCVIVVLFFKTPVSTGTLSLFIFWIIFIAGTANFFNFMDGINGIAGLTGIVGFGLMAFFAYFLKGETYIGLVCMILLFSCLGFLPFNFPKARIFMGDVGSVLLGFVFAGFVAKMSTNLSTFLCLVMFLCTFYADPIVTIFYRWRRRENLTHAHRGHLYQYMSNELKIPHWKVSLGYAGIQLLFGIMALVAYKQDLNWQVALFGIFGVSFIAAYRHIKRIKIENV